MKNNFKRLFPYFLIFAIVTSLISGLGISNIFAEELPPYNGTGNLFVNGDFSDSSTPNAWIYYKYGAVTGSMFAISGGVLKAKLDSFSDKSVEMALKQQGIPLEANKSYKLSFWLKSSQTVIFCETANYPNNKRLYIRFSKPDGTNDGVELKVGNKTLGYSIQPKDALFEKDQWKKFECTIDTTGFESVMPQGQEYEIRFLLGAGTIILSDGTETKTANPSIELLFDNFEIRESLPQVTLDLAAEGAAADDVVLTGAGSVTSGNIATITAAVKPGKNLVFDKWVDSTNTFISSNPIYTFTADSNKAFKAVFKPLPQYTIEVSANDSSLGNVTPSTGSYNYGDNIALTATPTGNNVFVCWEVNGKEVSKSSTYQLNVKGNHKIKANFAEADKHTVTFKDAGGRVFKIESVANGQAATAPVDTAKSGYVFDKWDKEFSNITADTVITAIYRQQDNMYTVSVTNGLIDGLGGGTPSADYKFDTLVTVIADDTTNFSYWKDAVTNKILSYNSTYSFYVSGAINLTAVSNAANVQKQPVAAINSVITGSGIVSFVAQCTVPLATSFEVVEYGVLLSQSYNPNDIFNLSTAGVIRGSTSSKTGLTGQYMVTKADATGQTWYGRAYTVYYDGGNLVTVYSDVKSGVGQ